MKKWIEIDTDPDNTDAELVDLICSLGGVSSARMIDPAPEPVAWIRFCSDGMYEGPIMHNRMEDVRKNSGAWTPLVAYPPIKAPSGFKLVPIEPTEEMLEAAWASALAEDARGVYDEMLAAAPSAEE